MSYKPYKIKLEEGITYRLIYKSQSGNYRWYRYEAIAKYIGRGMQEDDEAFSFRPLAGTSDIKHENILEAYEMPRTTEPRLPKRLGAYVQD